MSDNNKKPTDREQNGNHKFNVGSLLNHKKIILILAAILIIIVVVVFFVIGSCSDKDKDIAETTAIETTSATTETSSETTKETETVTEETEDVSTELSNYLTGLQMDDDSQSGHRPIALMINNVKVATPHIGVRDADVLFEMEVEGGLTRMMAFFASVETIPEIGSIRSLRHNFVDLAGAFDAIPAHVGGSYMANDQMAAQGTEKLDAQVLSSTFWRDEAWKRDRGYEHSVRTDGTKLKQAMENLGLRQEIDPDYASPFVFRDDMEIKPAGNTVAYEAMIPLTHATKITVVYNEDEKAYEKIQHGATQVDFIDGEAYTYTNVMILKTSVSAATGSDKLRQIDLSAGEGYYLSGGKATEINWSKGSTHDQFEFTDKEGKDIRFNRGNFYIAIVNKSGETVFSD